MGVMLCVCMLCYVWYEVAYRVWYMWWVGVGLDEDATRGSMRKEDPASLSGFGSDCDFSYDISMKRQKGYIKVEHLSASNILVNEPRNVRNNYYVRG